MSGCFPFLFVTFQKEGSSTLGHVFAVAIQVGTLNFLAASYSHAIVAFGTAAAVIPRHKQIVVPIVSENKRGLDGIGACILRGRVLFRGLVIRVIPAGDGSGFLARCDVHGRVEAYELDTVPERSPDQPRGIGFPVDDKIRIDGIPVVAFCLRGHHAAFVFPDTACQ